MPAPVSSVLAAPVMSLYGEGLSLRKIAARLGIGRKPARRLAELAGVSLRSRSEARREYSVNEQFFADPLTDEAAYWLGFLYADSYISKRPGKDTCLSLVLGSKDSEHVHRFRAALGATHPIYRTTRGDRRHHDH